MWTMLDPRLNARAQVWHLAALFLVIGSVSLNCSSTDKPKRVEGTPVGATFRDDFERDSLGSNYYATTQNYQLVNGALSAKGAFNHPLWLTKKLPRDVSIEFDCWSSSPDGDIKVEIFGDGQSHAATKKKVQYKATGYVAVMGGWGNSKSILARQDEHGTPGAGLSERSTPKVEVGKRYHWKLTRRGNTLRWFVDDMETPFLSLEDEQPLAGAGHDYFGVNNWESDSWFDNLSIQEL